MSALDAMFLDLEDGVSHMHVGSCAVFEGPAPMFDEIADLLAAKLPLIPRYRQKVRLVPGRLGRPVWVDDADFDLARHVHREALPAPGARGELADLVGRLMSTELDRRRPLWEVWMVEGLEDDRWALVSKVHHCMVDGVSGTELMAVLLDRQREPAPAAPIEPWMPAPEPSDVALVASSLRTIVAPVRVGAVGIAAARAPRRALRRIGDTLDGVASLGRRLLPATAGSLTGPIGPDRCWTWTRVTLADLRAIERVLGGTLNDVVLTVIAGAFRALLLERGEDPQHTILRALVPVSVRTAGDRHPSNQVAAMIAELPVSIADAAVRHRAVRAQLEELKRGHQAESTEILGELADLVPPAVLSLALRSATALSHQAPQHAVATVVTNVPGPRDPLYLAGRQLLDYLPFVPLAHGVRIGVAVVSYHGHLAFGLTGDADSVPDLDLMRRAVDDGLAELRRTATAARRSRSP